MKVVEVNQIFFLLCAFISFAVAQEIKNAVPGQDNILKLECENDSKISMFVANFSIWTESLNVNCPNRSQWQTLFFGIGIIVNCQGLQNCSVDLTNITIINCTDYRNYLNVKYTCNITEATTEITTTTKSEPDDDDDDSSEEEKSSTTTTTTKKPRGRVEPHYLPQPVPGLLTTRKPTRRPNNYPVPLIPVPAPRPLPQLPPLFGPFNRGPMFQHYNGGGFNAPPILLPLPFPAPVPIPMLGLFEEAAHCLALIRQ